MTEIKPIKESSVNKFYISIIIGLLLLLNIATPINYIIFFVITFIFCLSSINTEIVILLVLLPWERMLTLPGIGALVTILQIIMVLKGIQNKYFINLDLLEVSLIFYWGIIGIISFIISNSIEGISLCILLILVFSISKKIFTDTDLLNNGLKYSIISFILSIGYAVIHMNFGKRWIDGIGYVSVFQGVLKSNELAYYCALILFLICVSDLSMKKKIIFISIVSVALVATVSFTGIILGFISIIYTVLFDMLSYGNKEKFRISNRQKILFIFGILIIAIIIINISIGRVLIARIGNTIHDLLIGNTDKATSGREELRLLYMEEFNKLPIFNKFFGTSIMGRQYMLKSGFESILYPHNSFIELLFYSGYVGIIFLILVVFKRFITLYKSNKYNGKILAGIKIITIIEGLSVTMSGYSFWLFWFLL